MKYEKQKQLFFKSGINYDDLECEITRLEKERQSQRTNTNSYTNDLETYLEPRIGTKRKWKAFGGTSKKSHLNSDI